MGAFERLVAVVRPLVNSERTCDGKRLATARVVAQIWLFLRVPPHVLLQSGSLGEVLQADLALERSVAGMGLEMST